MIVRILGEGQLEVDDSVMAELNQLDGELEAAVEQKDEARFASALRALVDRVRATGRPLPDEVITPSELILPGSDATMDDVSNMLVDGGLIPG